MDFLNSNEGYEENIRQYNKKDGGFAILLYTIFLLMYAFVAVLSNQFEIVNKYMMEVGCILNVFLVCVTILLIKGKKQKLNSIGLMGGSWKKSCIIGVIIAAVLFFNNAGLHLIQGESFVETKKMILLIAYYLSVAVCEEIVFRGYIGTRLRSFLPNKWVAMVVVGFLFVLMHFPYRMIAYGMTLEELTINNLFWLIDLFITHMVLTFIYMKTNSLYGAIIPHWMSNLAYNLIVRQ